MLAAALAAALLTASPHAEVRAAARAVEAGRFLEAEEILRRALADAPDLAEAHQNLGAVLHRLGRYAEAEASFRAALARAPEMRAARLGLGLALLADSRPNEAAEAFRAVLAERPNDVDALVHLGWALLAADSPAAEAAFARAAVLTPRAGPRLGLALAREARGDLEGATAAAAEAVEADPRDAGAAYHRGRLAWRLGRYDEARTALERAVDLDPAGPAAELLARVLIAQGRAAEAETPAAGGSASIAALRAHAVEARGPAAEATAAWRIALARDPADEVLRHRFEEAIARSARPDTAAREDLGRWRLAAARAARARGDLLAERRHLLRALLVAPLLDEARAAHARHLEAAGRPVEAIGAWGIVLEITRDPALIREAEARRAALGRRAILEWERATGRAAPIRTAKAGDAAAEVEAGALDRALEAAGADAEPPRPALVVAVRAPAAALHPGVESAVAVEVADLLQDRYDARPRAASGATEDGLAAEARAAGADLLLIDLETEERERVAGRLRLVRADLRVDLDSSIAAVGPDAFGAAILAAVRRARAVPVTGRAIDLHPAHPLAPGAAVLVAGGRTLGFEEGLGVAFARSADGGEAIVGRGRVVTATESLAAVRLEEGSALPGDAVRPLPRAP